MLRLRLVTPDRILFEQEVDSVSLPTVDGEVTILSHHASLAALLVSGIMRYRSGDTVEEAAVSGGFVHIERDGTVLVLADTAERGEELDVSILETAKARAKEAVQKAASKDDLSFAMAAAGLERELARYRLAIKHRGRKKA